MSPGAPSDDPISMDFTFADAAISKAAATAGDRLAALDAAEILHSEPEETFDLIARFAAHVCGVPIGLVNFVAADHQWTKANCGLPGLGDLPLDVAFCPRTIRQLGVLEIPDTHLDPAFAANPLVVGEPHIRFYAGAPLRAKSGHALGALCVIDRKPNRLTDEQRTDLVRLAEIVSELVAMRVAARDALRGKVRVLSEALEHTSTPLMILERAGGAADAPVCTYVNLSFVDRFKLPAARLLGRSPFAILSGRRTDASQLAKLDASEGAADSVELELVIYDGDGVARTVEWHRRPVPSDGRSAASWVVSINDITAQRATAALLAKQAARMRALYQITSMRNLTGYAQVDSALKLGLHCLGLESGAVLEVHDESARVLNAVGRDRPLRPGDVVPLRDTPVRRSTGFDDVVVQAGGPERPPSIAAPVSLGDAHLGAVCFTGRAGRTASFTDADREFVRLIGSFVGPAIERKMQKERLDSLAFYDSLTGLGNRAMLLERLEAAFEKARRGDKRLALHYIDLDGFKAVNDDGGHAAGDAVLRAVAKRLRSNVREGDLIARIGGDEFVVVQTMIEAAGDTEALAKRLIEAMREPFAWEGETYRVGATIGIAFHTPDIATAADLLGVADRALYRAKTSAKGTMLVGEPQTIEGRGAVA